MGELSGKILDVPLTICSNSTAFSLDGKHMYHTDTLTRILNVYKYDTEEGQVSDSFAFQDFKDYPNNWPDGSIVDSKD